MVRPTSVDRTGSVTRSADRRSHVAQDERKARHDHEQQEPNVVLMRRVTGPNPPNWIGPHPGTPGT
jgi:hypothetical protein